MASLSLRLAETRHDSTWITRQLVQHHYLHRPVDARCSPMSYLIYLSDSEPVGCLVFGRPESTRCTGWYGSVEEVQADQCRFTRWQMLNLARVWLHPCLQAGGERYIPNAATQIIALALRRVGYDYLLAHPPCFLHEPWEIRECLSYCDSRTHRGTLYRAANFRFVRENEQGIQTYTIPLRRLMHDEKHAIEKRAQDSYRSRRYRAQRAVADIAQSPLFAGQEVSSLW